MTLSKILISELFIIFFVIIVGYFIGHIKIFGIGLDLAGVLITAVAVGYVIALSESVIGYTVSFGLQSNMKIISSLGTALFVSVIGITTGYSLNIRGFKDLKAALIGALMVVSAYILVRIILLFDKQISISNLLGCFCGALTTTPGLSAVCENKNIIAEEAVLGYGSTYIFGVIFTVLFVQKITKKRENSFNSAKKDNELEPHSSDFNSVLQIGVAVLIGRLIGALEFFGFSIGDSGGMLCAGIIIGVIIKKLLPTMCVRANSFKLLRSLGLVLFFAGTGITSGMQLSVGINIKTVLYGILMTVIPIVVGWALYKVMFSKNTDSMPTVIAGGMTSTPAVGVIIQKNNGITLSKYSLAYAGALITVILLVRSF